MRNMKNSGWVNGRSKSCLRIAYSNQKVFKICRMVLMTVSWSRKCTESLKCQRIMSWDKNEIKNLCLENCILTDKPWQRNFDRRRHHWNSNSNVNVNLFLLKIWHQKIYLFNRNQSKTSCSNHSLWAKRNTWPEQIGPLTSSESWKWSVRSIGSFTTVS